MAANMGRPCPADPLSYRWRLPLRITCQCGHAATVQVGEMARAHGMAPETRLWELVEHLTCSRCGRREAQVRAAP
jgi:hypothetical protein